MTENKWLLTPPRAVTRTEYDNMFIGPCLIKIGDLDIATTMENNPTKVTIKKEVTEIKPACKGGATVNSITKVTSITAEATVLFNSEAIEKLTNETGFDFNSDFQELKKIPVKFKSDEVLELLECNVTMEQNLNFKKNTASEIKLVITALKTENGYYKIGGIW